MSLSNVFGDVFQAHFVNDAYQFASSAKSGRVSKSYSKQPIEWTNIIPQIENPHPTSQFANRFTYTGNFVFYGLDASTEYEVIIQSRNKEGWSDASDIFRFSTRDRGKFCFKKQPKTYFSIMFQICCRLQSNGIGLSQSTRIFLKRRISRSNINVHYSTCTDVSINGILRES